MKRSIASALGLTLLVGCATKQAPPAEQPALPAPVVMAPEPKPLLTGAAAKAQAQQLVRQAFDSLNAGDEEKARTDLQQAKELDPENKNATCLLKGIAADPVATLGRESTPYTVRPGETMGRIAQRALGEICEFYLLARYNQIRIPKQLAAGQTIRIPGKTPLAPADAPTATRPVQPEPATAPPPTPAIAAPASPPAPVSPMPTPQPAVATPSTSKTSPGNDVATTRAAVEQHHRAAQAAFRRQDLATAINEWNKVLELDPANELAQVRRQEAIELDRRIKQVK